MATPRIAEIEAQAAKLRDQSARLNRTQADRDERHYSEYGSRVDDIDLAAASARGAAAKAHARANELHDRAQEANKIAKDFEEKALADIAKDEPFAAEMADDLREQAQLLRAGAASDTQRAERAERAARTELERADELERESKQIEQEGRDRTAADDGMRHTANELENKAFELESAARSLRQADATFGFLPDEKATFIKAAEDSLKRAEEIKPDFSRVETDALVEAGIPISEIPGAELMDPTTMSSTATGAPASDDLVAGSFGSAEPATTGATDTMVAPDVAAPVDVEIPAFASDPADTMAALTEPAPVEEPPVDLGRAVDPTGDFAEVSVDEPVAAAADDTAFEFQS
jgi:hypothetical protein